MREIIRLGSDHPVEHFAVVARLHTAEIHHGILPRLGLPFLSRLYYELARAPKAGVWVAFEEAEIVGFIAGCADMPRTYRRLLSRPAVVGRLIVALGAVWRLGLSRLASPLTYIAKGRKTTNDASTRNSPCTAEVLALAVSPTVRGRGIGGALVRVFEQEIRTWSAASHYRVSTNAADPNSNFFYQALGFSPCGRVRHHDLVLQVYEKCLEMHRT